MNISFDNATGNYNVKIPQGSNLNEVFFGINVLIKCLVRDGIVESEEKIYETLKRYATDPQYQELTEAIAELNDHEKVQ